MAESGHSGIQFRHRNYSCRGFALLAGETGLIYRLAGVIRSVTIACKIVADKAREIIGNCATDWRIYNARYLPSVILGSSKWYSPLPDDTKLIRYQTDMMDPKTTIGT